MARHVGLSARQSLYDPLRPDRNRYTVFRQAGPVRRLESYELAGGIVRRDLFDPKNGGYVQDAVLLDSLATQKLEAIAAEVKAEGWKWTESRIEFGWTEQDDFATLRPDEAALSDDLQTETDQLQSEREELLEAEHETDEDQAAANNRMEAIEARLDELDAQRRTWTDETKAMAGAVVHLSRDGGVEIERGLTRPEDEAQAPAPRRQDEDGQPAVTPKAAEEAEGSALPASLIEDLTAHKTAALRIELARSPAVALATVVHALATGVFYHRGSGTLKVSIKTRSLRSSIKDHDSCTAVLALHAERERLGDLLPGDQGDLFAWCLNASMDMLLDVLAVGAAHGIDAVESKSDPNQGGVAQGRDLAAALGLDMMNWYAPTAAGYFSRVSKAVMLADIAAAKQVPPAPSWEKLKKAELASVAEREVLLTRWLPSPLR